MLHTYFLQGESHFLASPFWGQPAQRRQTFRHSSTTIFRAHHDGSVELYKLQCQLPYFQGFPMFLRQSPLHVQLNGSSDHVAENRTLNLRVPPFLRTQNVNEDDRSRDQALSLTSMSALSMWDHLKGKPCMSQQVLGLCFRYNMQYYFCTLIVSEDGRTLPQPMASSVL